MLQGTAALSPLYAFWPLCITLQAVPFSPPHLERPSGASGSAPSPPFHRIMDSSRRSSTSFSRRQILEPGPSSSRPSAATVFLLCPSLAAGFGGPSSAFKVASFLPATRAIFFPSWHVRESAIGRSPLRFDDFTFHFSNWVEVGERDRGFLRHKVWIKLLNWPILSWNKEDVKAAVSSFGELWDVDLHSEQLSNVSFFCILVRCPYVSSIPKSLELMVEDRCFFVPIEIESCDEACPILLREDVDDHQGLDSLDAQEEFIRRTGFRSISAPPGILD
uniref:DUF4283 domain-containing protein n=1 Tax=Ananas comosus var. bracteatus TaxID=296719 RepID=A0A6V7QQM9_ANACO